MTPTCGRIIFLTKNPISLTKNFIPFLNVLGQTKIPSFYYSEAEIGEDLDKRDYIVSNDKIESTGFKTEHSLSYGIQELIKGFQIIKKNEYSNV